MLEPLRDWLGDWALAAEEHHLRWDGRGYPKPLAGTERFDVLLGNTYRAFFLDGLGLRRDHFQLAVAAARNCRVRRVLRPRRPFLLEELAAAIEEDFRS